jgi:hypothetical protein
MSLSEPALHVRIRPRNFLYLLHIGSEEAGPRVAAIVSIVETCRRLNFRVRDYLGSVIPGLANFPINRIAEFTPPHGWSFISSCF